MTTCNWCLSNPYARMRLMLVASAMGLAIFMLSVILF
jgi:hypothetical protein